MEKESENITIIGTGNYGIALGKRLMKYGYKVIYGSRNPNYNYLNECFNDLDNNNNKFNVTTIGDAWFKTDEILFLAISSDDYELFVNEIIKYQSNKEIIIVELSNPKNNSNLKSNAENLDNLFQSKLKDQKVNIIKGFNLTVAYSMSSCELKGNNETIVPICGDDIKSKERLTKLCNRINLRINDIGKLEKNAYYLESLNDTTFLEWQLPSLNCILFVLFNFVWIFVFYFYFPKKPHTFEKYLNDSSLLAHLNKVLAFSSLQLLAFVYLSSTIAAVYQLAYGTKYKRFPSYLDFILKSRKQFGLWAFLFASAHVLCTIFITNPAYIADWYQKVDNQLTTMSKLTIHGEINLITGIFGYIIMLLVALSSINSIANSLNWNEWRFVQSKLGLICLFIGLMHTVSMYLNIFLARQANNYNLLYLLTRVKLIAAYLPAFVLLFRFIFAYFPPISQRIENIRKGKVSNKKLKQN